MFILWQYHKQWPTLPFDGIWLKMDNTIYEFHSHLIYAALVKLMQFKLISPAWNHSNKSYSNEIQFHPILEFTNNAIGSFDIGLYLVWPELHVALKNSDFFFSDVAWASCIFKSSATVCYKKHQNITGPLWGNPQSSAVNNARNAVMSRHHHVFCIVLI